MATIAFAFLALKWAVTIKFSDYLYGVDFTVVTDSNPLTYFLTTANLDTTSYRWLSTISTYSFKLQYRAGTQNRDADGLSRRPHEELQNDCVPKRERENQTVHSPLPERSGIWECCSSWSYKSHLWKAHHPLVSRFYSVKSISHSHGISYHSFWCSAEQLPAWQSWS